MNKMQPIRLVRALLLFFIIMLFLSGVTAIPIDMELSFLLNIFFTDGQMHQWLQKVLNAYREVNEKNPFLLYGYDWLAFAHFVLAILFIGPYRNPVKNIWVIEFGLIACVLIIPLALIAGALRGIPPGWRLIDCSFGVFGFIPLWICYIQTKKIAINQNQTTKN
jgi:hypothetical protein